MPYVVYSTVAGRLAVALVPPHQTSLATGGCGAGLRWGSALGFVIPHLVFDGLSTTDDLDQIGRRFHLFDCVLVFATSVCFISLWLLYQNDNESGSAAERNKFKFDVLEPDSVVITSTL